MMTTMFIAKTIEGKEFVFSRKRMIAVPTSSAWDIAFALNKIRYDLKPNQIWYVYQNDWYYDDMIREQIRSYSPKRNIKVVAYCR
jgi:hypothetical protein